jgi:ATP-binding cassette subfamily F protein 3
MGDDTPALQAVLDADVWRKHLLAEQDVCIPLRITDLAAVTNAAV